MKGQRHRFSREESAWISTQLQALPRDAVRSTDQWQSLYAAYLAQFPDRQETTLQHYKAHVKYLDNRAPPSQLTRVQQHLRGYEERSEERKRQRRRRRLEGEGRGEDRVKEERTSVRGADHAQEEEDEPEEEEETVDSDGVDMEIHIKTENNEVAGPRATPRPRLRTKASADAFAPSGKEDEHSRVRKFGVHRRTYGMYASDDSAPPSPDTTGRDGKHPSIRKFGIRRDGGAITASPLPATRVLSSTGRTRPLIRPSDVLMGSSPTAKRQRVELQPSTVRAVGSSSAAAPGVKAAATAIDAQTSPTAIKLKLVELQLCDAQHEAKQWKTKFETAAAQLATEKSTSKVLQSRLDETLAALRATEKKLERVEAATPTAVTVANGAGGGGQTPMSFTIRVNVDVSQNGERLHSSSQTLSVDATSRSGSESPVYC